MKNTIAAALVAAAVFSGGQAAATPAPTPAVARSCAVVFVAMRNLSSYDILNAKAQVRSKAYEKRAVEVAVKGGIIPSATAPLPKDLTDEGAALVVRFNKGQVSDVQLASALTACQRDFGYTSLP